MTALLNDDTPMLGATDLPSEMTQLDPSQPLSCSAAQLLSLGAGLHSQALCSHLTFPSTCLCRAWRPDGISQQVSLERAQPLWTATLCVGGPRFDHHLVY